MRRQKAYFIRLIAAGTAGAFCLMAFTGVTNSAFFLKTQMGPALLRLAAHPAWSTAAVVGGWVLVTLLFGRFYCGLVCPLGLFQEVEMLLLHRRCGVSWAGPLFRWGVALALWGSLLGGTTAFLRLVEPYSMTGNALTLGMTGLIGIGLIALVTVPAGRFFCTHVCPVGAVLGALSRFARVQIQITTACVHCGRCEQNCPAGCMRPAEGQVDNTRCVRCLKCLSVCPVGAVRLAPAKKAPVQPVFQADRRRLLKVVGLGVLCAGAVAAGRWVRQTAQAVTARILPPGAGSVDRFLNHCTNCGACVQNCPQNIIRPADESFGVPSVQFNHSYCRLDCHRCSQVCPTGALQRLSLSQKQKLRISVMQFDRLTCIGCYECVRVCPKKALSVVRGQRVPAYDVLSCIGCGKCQSVCPVGAITAQAVPTQMTTLS